MGEWMVVAMISFDTATSPGSPSGPSRSYKLRQKNVHNQLKDPKLYQSDRQLKDSIIESRNYLRIERSRKAPLTCERSRLRGVTGLLRGSRVGCLDPQ